MRRTMAGVATALLALAMTANVGHAMTALEEYGWGYDQHEPLSAGTQDISSGDGDCGAGRRLVCETKTTQQCMSWQSTGGTLGGSTTSITVGMSTTCSMQVTTTTYKYYP